MGDFTTWPSGNSLPPAVSSTAGAAAGAGAAAAGAAIGIGVGIIGWRSAADSYRLLAFLDLDFRYTGFFEQFDQFFNFANIHNSNALHT